MPAEKNRPIHDVMGHTTRIHHTRHSPHAKDRGGKGFAARFGWRTRGSETGHVHLVLCPDLLIVPQAEARDKAVSEREKAVADKEKVCAEREKKADKAKQEYSLLFNELKWRKRALDDQHRKLERASSDVTTASSATSDETTATTATTASTATARGSTEGSGADERWAKRNELPSRTASAANKPRPSTSSGEHPQSRSPTPHPRQGFLMADGATADNKLSRVPSAADSAAIKPRYNGVDGFKGKGLVKAGSDVSDEAQETSQPFNVHARRMFAAPPVGDDLDSSIDSPPAPRRLNTAPPAAAVA